MSKAELDKRVVNNLAEAMRAARGEGGVVPEEKESVKVKLPPPDFSSKFKDAGDTAFSECFGMAPPKGMPDLKAKVYKSTDWPKSDRVHIPDKKKFDTYVPDVSVLYQLWVSVLKNNKKALVVGPTGSGKTTTQEYFCSMIQQPYYRINGRGDMESDTVLGKPWVSGEGMSYELGPMVKAAKAGYWIAFDEPWKVPSPIQVALSRFYEKDGSFQLDDMPGELGEILIPSDPRCRLVLADNVVGTGDSMDQYAATMIQDGSTLNRMDVVIYQGYMPRDKEVEMVIAHVPELNKNVAGKMIDFITLCRKSYEQRALTAALSPRNLLSWAELGHQLHSIHLAAAWVMNERFAEDNEKALVNEHYRTVFDRSIGE